MAKKKPIEQVKTPETLLSEGAKGFGVTPAPAGVPQVYEPDIGGTNPLFKYNKTTKGQDIYQNGQYQGSVDQPTADLYNSGASPQNVSNPLMQKLMDTRQRMDVRNQIIAKRDKGMMTSDIINEIINQPDPRNLPIQQQATEALKPEQLKQNSMSTEAAQTLLKGVSPVYSIAEGYGKINPIAKAVNDAGVKAVAEGLPKAVGTISESIDALMSVVGGRKTIKVKAATESFSSWNNILEDDMALVAAGVKSSSETRADLDQAEAAISRLESTTKGLSIFNLRYWVDTGASIQAQVIEERRQLQIMRQKLEAAERSALMREYGLA